MAHYPGHNDANNLFAENWKNGTTNMQQGNTGASFMGSQPNISGMYSPQYTEQQRVLNQSPAQWKMDFNKGVAGSYNPQTPFGQGGSPTYGAGGIKLPKLPNQNTPWGWGGEGGKGQTLVTGLAAAGNLWMANKQLKADDFRFERATEQWDKNYDNQVATVNDDTRGKKSLAYREAGMSAADAQNAANEYIKQYGVGQERTA